MPTPRDLRATGRLLLGALAGLNLTVDAAAQGAAAAESLPRPPLLWVEVPDAPRLERELSGSSLGALWGELEGVLPEEQLELLELLPSDASPAAQRLQRAVLRSDLEDLARELFGEAGLSHEQAVRLVDALGGGLALGVFEGAGGSARSTPSILVALSLRPGGNEVIVDGILPELEADTPAAQRAELLEVEGQGHERRAAWRWKPGAAVLPGFLLVRPGLAAWTDDRDLAEGVLRSGPGPGEAGAHPAAELLAARGRSAALGELVFAHTSGPHLGALLEEQVAAAVLRALEVEAPRAVELGLRVEGAQLATRLRLERATARAAPATTPAFTSLDALTSDALLVVGAARSPWSLTVAAADLERAFAGRPASQRDLLARLDEVPLFAALARPEALSAETLLFARPAGLGLPMVFLATPRSEPLDRTFASLARRGSEEIALGGGYHLRSKERPEATTWVLSRGVSTRHSVLAFARLDETWVAANSAADLASLTRQRGRERLLERERAVASVRADVAELLGRVGARPEHLVGFLHVRAGPLAEQYWPSVQLFAQLTGAVEHPEELPDAVDVAELCGNTTSVVLDRGAAVELHGRGLLGGLLLLF